MINIKASVNLCTATQAHKKSDIWSLGCILYSMVYSGTPFQKFKDPIKKMTAIISASYNISFLPTPLGTDVVNTMKVGGFMGDVFSFLFVRF